MGRGIHSKKSCRSTEQTLHTGCCGKCGKIFSHKKKKFVHKLLRLHGQKCQAATPLSAEDASNLMANQMLWLSRGDFSGWASYNNATSLYDTVEGREISESKFSADSSANEVADVISELLQRNTDSNWWGEESKQ